MNNKSLADFELRELTVDDAPEAAALAESVGWGKDIDRFRQVITWGGTGCFCFTHHNRLAATSTTIQYGRERGWIGMVIVHPEFQGRGLGTHITKIALDYLCAQGVHDIMLVATEQGRPVYEKLGFRSLSIMEAWMGEAKTQPDCSSRQMTADDYPDVVALDAQAFGVRRSQVLTYFFQTYPQLAWCDDNDGEGEKVGYILAQTSDGGKAMIGPWMHRTADGAEKLLKTALNALAGRQVRINISEYNEAARQMAVTAGLECRSKTTRMIYGSRQPLTDVFSKEYGASLPAIG